MNTATRFGPTTQRSFFWLPVCALLLCLSFIIETRVVAEEDRTGSLLIRIVGLASDEGKVRVAVFNSEALWLQKPVYARILDIEGGVSAWNIEDIPVGNYGIAVFHDLNENAVNDANFLGIPKEPYGFSNNVRARFGPPKWKKAMFTVSDSASDIEIKVK